MELAENQIEKLVDKGVYIKVSFGVKQSGLIFIPNYQLDIMEEENHKKYKVYIRETSSYFVYNKENMDNNCFIKGRTLIRQLSNDSQKLPYKVICNLSKILISRIQDISDSPRSKRDICDFERCSSATEHRLICFPLRTFLSVMPSFDFIISHFPNKN
ncbi:hypothetical protein PCS8203_00761 [Streptococcus pneumoniae PCS8203]|nr:hypothetical protein PCS8106_01399 [Streptococcus pneumoniae PCS8106]ELU58120.1 hypothetical protein PCS8203_00761 [Streptococcus pneumoniae PCS8203]